MTVDLATISVEHVIRAAKVVKRIAYLIAAIGAAASYGTQVELLKNHGMETWAAYAIPATIDLLAICAAIALAVPGLPEPDRKWVFKILAIAVLVSVTANLMGGHNMITRAGHAWPVIAYLAGEGIANRIRNYVARLLSAEAARQVPPVEATSTPVHVQAAVGKPTAALASKPGTAKSKILQLAAATPRPSDEDIAAQVGTKPGWVKHVIKTSQN